MNPKEFLNDVCKQIHHHAPVLCLGAGVFGFGVTVVAACVTTYKNHDKIASVKDAKFIDKVTTIAPCYIPETAMFALSSYSVYKCHDIDVTRAGVIGSAFEISKQINEQHEANQKRYIEPAPAVKKTEPYDEVPEADADGKYEVYDATFKRYYRDTWNGVDAHFNRLNNDINCSQYVSLNDYYAEVGLECLPEVGDMFVWYDHLSVEKHWEDHDGKPCIAIYHNRLPRAKVKYGDFC